MSFVTRSFVGVSSGALLFVVLHAAGDLFAARELHASDPWWLTVIGGARYGLIAVGPAFLAGLIARERGWVVGVLTSLAVVGIAWAPISLELVRDPTRASLLLYGARTVVEGCVAGAAGQLAARRWSSNNSFKGMPLRGTP